MAVDKMFIPLLEAINDGRIEDGVAEARALVNNGLDVSEMFDKAIVPSLADLGSRFQRLEIYLPEMIYAADVVKAIQNDLAELIQNNSAGQSQGKIVIGTTFGDIHDLGKNIVVAMLEVNGYKVYDLGVGVKSQDFIEKAKEVDADIIAVSCLLTTSIPYISDVVDLLKDSNLNSKFKVLIGGGPITPDLAKDIGANGYGDNAADAVDQTRALLNKS